MSGTSEGEDHYVYQVHPSYKSETAIRIIRRLAPPPTFGIPKIQQENPYIFKPKSYSKKRNFRETLSSSYIPPPPPKKFKFNNSHKQIASTQNILDKTYLEIQLNNQNQHFFKPTVRENQKIETEQSFYLPLKLKTDPRDKRNPLLSHKIQIVSTSNQKLAISIHQGLLRANTNHSKQQLSLQGVVNPFNSELKKHYSESIEFIRDYKSGYTPIELQNRSKKSEETQGGYQQTKKQKIAGSNSKTHFIKKKQSTLSLPRTCGVSYIKPSQSTQNHPYDPLPPLIFQCSTSCSYTPDLRQKYQSQIEKLIQLSQTRWLPVILSNQEHMRDILLGKPHGKIIWVHGIHNLWPLFNQGTFMLVLFDKQLPQNEEDTWKQFNTCYFKFGILAKRSTSGKKLFLKSIQLQNFNDREQTMSLKSFGSATENPINSQIKPQEPIKSQGQVGLGTQFAIQRPQQGQIEEKKLEDTPPQDKRGCRDVYQQFMKQLKNCRTVITMSLKFEMYVHEQFWKASTDENKNLLNAIIHSFEEHLQKKAIEVIRDRLQLSNKFQRQQLVTKALLKIKQGNDISHLIPMERYSHQGQDTFNVSVLKSLNQSLQKRDLISQKPTMQLVQLFKDKEGKENMNLWEKSLKMPIYYISTRDSFAFDLAQKITIFQREGRQYTKIQYSFEPSNVPENFGQYKKLFPDLSVGVTCYHGFFSEQQLQMFQAQTLQTEVSAFKNKFLQMTVQPTIIGNRIKRTKFFFGYRYMWTRCQLAEPNSYVGAGVRRDVTPAPKWIKDIENPMIQHSILQPNFINSVAINVYHDGTQGLAQHFDDAVRFRQPIYTVRLVSDGRLSFGSQFYGFCNGAFIIPLPRGCICILNENSYAANGVKHCVRPCDMSGKSAAVIMRQMHHQVVTEAAKYDQLIDFPAWLSTISQDPKAITFAEQKRRQAEQIMGDEQNKKEKQKEKSKSVIMNDL